MDQLPRLGKRELICLLLFTCNYVVFVWRGFLFLWVLGLRYLIVALPEPSYNYFTVAYKSCPVIYSSDTSRTCTNDPHSTALSDVKCLVFVKV